MSNPLLKHQLHQFFCRWAHVFEALTEWDYGKAHTFEVLCHLYRAPAVESNLADIETLTEVFDEFFDVSVMNDVALGRFQVTLPFPYVIWDMIPCHAGLHIIFGDPEVRQNDVFVIFVFRREHEHKRCDIR